MITVKTEWCLTVFILYKAWGSASWPQPRPPEKKGSVKGRAKKGENAGYKQKKTT